MSNPILTEALKSSPSRIIDLYEADFNSLGQNTILRFFSDTTELGDNVFWNGYEYNSIPCEMTDIEWSGAGQLPTPKFKVANVDGFLTILNRDYQDLLGLKVTRIRTMIKFIDAVNFNTGTNPTADPTAAFPPEIYYVDRKAIQTAIYSEYELVSALDISSVQLPRRTILQNLCSWKYKDPTTCNFTHPTSSPLYYKADGTLTGVQSQDVCGKRLSDCKLRFNQTTNILNFGGYPGAGLFT